jgi:hypothetical protein
MRLWCAVGQPVDIARLLATRPLAALDLAIAYTICLTFDRHRRKPVQVVGSLVRLNMRGGGSMKIKTTLKGGRGKGGK